MLEDLCVRKQSHLFALKFSPNLGVFKISYLRKVYFIHCLSYIYICLNTEKKIQIEDDLNAALHNGFDLIIRRGVNMIIDLYTFQNKYSKTKYNIGFV